LVLMLAVGLSEGLGRWEGWTGIEQWYGDAWFRSRGVAQPPQQVVLVKLDEATLGLFPDEPLVFWTPHYARACAVLRQLGVKVIGMDMLFSTSPEHWLSKLGGQSQAAREFDQAFRQELAQGRIVLAGMQSARETLLPAVDFLLPLPDFDLPRFIGAADMVPDPDGTIRRIGALPPGRPQRPDMPQLLTLPFLLALHATGQSPQAESWRFAGQSWQRDGELRPLVYAGPPGTIPGVSLSRLLQPGALDDPELRALAGKVVIIGASYGGMNDVHVTPYGRGLFGAPLMLGAEIQAQSVEAILSGRMLTTLGTSGRLAGAVLLVLFGILAWLRLDWPRGGLALLGLLLAAAVLGRLAFAGLALWPVAQWQAALVLAWCGVYGWRFSHGEREHQRLRRIFSRYVEPQVIETLLASPQLPQLGGESVEVTVLFSDIRNFTTISEQLAPEEVVEMLNTYFERACAVLAAEGGCIDKFIGDAIMVEFGMPLRQPDHALRAIRAGLALCDVARSFREWMTARFPGRALPEFGIGVGIHTGPAVVGNIGASSRMEYTAIGDTVNLASRLEGQTRILHCDMLVSAETLAGTGAVVRTGQTAVITVKGRVHPVSVAEVLAIEKGKDDA
jgi:adenylate cyclase